MFDMMGVNIKRIEIDRYLDTGFMYPVVVPPKARDLFNCPLGVWSMGEGTKNIRVGFGGEVEWRRVSFNPDMWLFVARIEMDNLLSPDGGATQREGIKRINELLPDGMHFPDGTAMGGSAACARDMGKHEECYQECMKGYAQQTEEVWTDPAFHLSLRLRDRMLSATAMSAQDWWLMSSPLDVCTTESHGPGH